MPRKVLFALGLALAGALVAAYLPALQAGFVWNDDTYVTANPTLDGVDGLRRIWTDTRSNEQYYPMVFTTFWLEKRLWSLHPFGYHLVNVLLHAASALLLWWFLARLGLPAPYLAAAAFALHPMCVESVAWVTERKNTLSLLLSLLAAHAYLSHLDAKNLPPLPRKKRKARPQAPWFSRPGPLYAAALGVFTLALFAKTTASVLPGVLLVLVWWRRGSLSGADARPLLPFFAIGAGLAFNTAWLERTMVQATGSEWSLGPLGKLVLAGKVAAFYAVKLAFPADLAFIYSRWTIDPRVFSQWLPAAAGLLALAAAWALRHRAGRGPLASLLLFGGVLFPAMGFFNVYAMRYSYVADHFAYQAVAVFTSALVCGLASWLPRAPAVRRAGTVLALVVLGLLGVLTYRQCRSYHDEETLWRHTLEKTPDSFMAQTNYGYMLVSSGRVDEAIPHFEAALRLRPDNVPALLNLARVEEQRGRLDEAAAHLRSAWRIDPTDVAVLINLATVDTKAGRYAEAVATYEEAIRIPSADEHLAHNGMGVALMGLGRVEEAVAQFRETLRLRPDYDRARANLERATSILENPRSLRR